MTEKLNKMIISFHC